MSFHYSRFGSNVRQQTALTIEGVRALAPSAFATQAHDSRSARFTYIPTSDIIEALIGQGFRPFKAVQSLSRIEGKSDFTKHLIRFRHPDTALSPLGQDATPEVILINAHDGTSAYKLFGGVFRLVCENGLIVADSTVGSLSVPHKGNIIDQVVEASFEIIGQTHKSLQAAESWNQLQLTSGEQELYAKTAHEIRFADTDGVIHTPITPTQLLAPRRTEDNGNSLWQVFNRTQENAIQGGLSARAPVRQGENRGRLITTRRVKGIDTDVKLNRALWTLTERFAALKKGEEVKLAA